MLGGWWMVGAWTAWGLSMTRKGDGRHAMLHRRRADRRETLSVDSPSSSRVSTESASILVSLLLLLAFLPAVLLRSLLPAARASTSLSPCQGDRRSPIAVSTCLDVTEPRNHPSHRTTEPPIHRAPSSQRPGFAAPHRTHPEKDREHPVRDVAPEYPPPPLTLRLCPPGASRPRPDECAGASAHCGGSAMGGNLSAVVLCSCGFVLEGVDVVVVVAVGGGNGQSRELVTKER